MRIHLVLPGLIWPDAGAPAITRELHLPALTKMLRHARIIRQPDSAPETWLSQLFGAEGESVSFAAIRRAGENSPPEQSGHWLCADPVNLYFAQEHLLLSDAAALRINEDEASALTASLNDFFLEEENDFIRFEACTPAHWYLHLITPVSDVNFYSLHDVIGRPVNHFMPEGRQARRWQRVTSEIQMLLHNHPVNTAREQKNLPPINSVWFWGQGAEAPSLRPPAPVILTNDTFTRGIARSAGVTPLPPDHLPEQDSLIVLDNLRQAAVNMDAAAWRKNLVDLESHWFSPLLAALKTKRCATLRISAPEDRGTAAFEIQAHDLWKFWQRSATPADLTASPVVSPDGNNANASTPHRI